MKRKNKKVLDEEIPTNIRKEMGKPRIAKSARSGEVGLAAARIALGKLRKNKLQVLLVAAPQGTV